MARWLALLALLLALLPLQAATVTDDRGRTVSLPGPPARIVSLLPSLTETVCTLGACDRLVAVDDFSDWPAAIARLPRVGGVDDVRIESIVGLQPDLVLLHSTARALPRLQALGVPVLAFDLKTLADVGRVLDKLGTVLAIDAGPAWRSTLAAIDRAGASVPPGARGRSVYVEVGGGYAASAGSHVGEILARLGAANVVPASLGSVPHLNPEFAVRADPELLIVPAANLDDVRRRPGWSRMRALRGAGPCVLSAAEGNVVMRPGPRLGEAAAILARCLAAAKREGR